ncbi:hydroxyacylglutathione hydrolase [Aurantimonas marianensis]|uniref:Hydroxyacylglutathione hydrolase n=1 Tax=Aurantimonas marianensis TaxID=2920428 RepID=A0A9X2H9X8_9HYPH|nr:hydroxyacylglutathione hydrolase [Aurantimonas marianensis]MCP3056886.1 hydroxyacylglutathione hydrolase [Aurantimonas marianensis]
MAEIEIRQFVCRGDNFGVLVHEKDSGTTIAIDAPEEAPILAELEKAGWNLTHILTTHHHGDHVAANEALKARFGLEIVGPEKERAKIPGIDRTVSGGDAFELGGIRVEAIDTPGHTLGEISYYLPDAKAVFAADALFSLGCGRLFEGDAAMMWDSLQRLRALPDETMLYCGHEYTATNARCAIDVDPRNPALRERVSEVEALLAQGKPTLPVSLGREKQTNPFLRADEPALMQAMGMEDASPAAVFAAIRKKRDQY